MPLKKTVILVAEDEAVVRNIVRIILESHGAYVLAGSDGEEALELSRAFQGTIDLVLTDVQMPNMDGPTLTRKIRKERPGTKVIVMSGKTSSEIREIAEQLDVEFLQKPFIPSALEAKIRRTLGR